MLSKVHTIALNGINGEIVEVEVDINRGLGGDGGSGPSRYGGQGSSGAGKVGDKKFRV